MYGGDGLARLDGRVVLAPFVLPGERIRAAARAARSRAWSSARTLEVLEPSPERVAAAVPGISAAAAAATTSTRRTNSSSPPSAPSWRRNCAGWERSSRRRRSRWWRPSRGATAIARNCTSKSGQIGYREARSHRLCAIDECPISSPKINQAIARARRRCCAMRAGRASSTRSRSSPTSARCSSTCSRPTARWRAASSSGARKRFRGLVEGALDYQGRFRVSRNSFFQVNRFLAGPTGGDRAGRRRGRDGARPLRRRGTVFAGAGAALPPGDRRGIRRGAARDLRFNAERAGLASVKPNGHGRGVSRELERAPDFVLADPPRAGLGKTVVERLAALSRAASPSSPAIRPRSRAIWRRCCGGYSIAR